MVVAWQVKPISPFSSNPQEIVHKQFINYENGEVMQGLNFWRPLYDTLWDYINHSEAKLNGKTGILERKHVHVDDVIHIGKEINDVEKVGIMSSPECMVYQDNDELKRRLLNMTYKEARDIGLNEETLRKIKERISNAGELNLYKKTYPVFI